MRILHICNSYCSTKVHSELYSELDKLGVEQVVYAYPTSPSMVGNNQFEGAHTKFVYSDIFRSYHRLLFHKKIHDVTKDVCKRVDMSKIDCIHATTLFSDGSVAYALHKKYGIPYVVAMRNTDVNEFMGYAPHTWMKGRSVLEHAQKIVFISPSIYRHFRQKWFFRSIAEKCVEKSIICPNGINEYWIDNIDLSHRDNRGEVLYVGRFDSNKNVLRLIQAFLMVRKEHPDMHMTLVGGKGSQEKEIVALADANKEAISYLGPVYDREELKRIMRRSSVFAMASIFETFGLVYVEALSQGLPILFTKGQGVDGYFKDNIGVAVCPKTVNSIEYGLQELIENREKYQGYKDVDFEQFRWSNIAIKYKDIILNRNYEITPIPTTLY